MTDPLQQLIQANSDLYQQFVNENLAADRAMAGGQVTSFVTVQAKSARDALAGEEAKDGDGDS